jgi:hypothetical protein
MNKIVIIIIFLTVIALVVLYLYSFGPLAGIRTAQNFNPVSLQTSSSKNLSVSNKTETFGIYHNKDLTENYYTVQLPKDLQVLAGKNPGGYAVSSTNANGEIGLQDVPDNSTLELYILSQDEPKLKSSLSGYNRTDYKKLSINGNDAYQLVYASKTGSDAYETIRTYIVGPDHAGLIILSSKQSDFQGLQPTFNSIINSFNWENK